MKLHRNDSVVILQSLEDIPGSLTVIGWDEAGEIIASSPLSPRRAFTLTGRLRRAGWFPQGTERQKEGLSVVYARTCIGLICERCEGTGWIPHYGHVDRGICFACNGTGKPKNGRNPPSRNNCEIFRGLEGLRLRTEH